jgi:two-component system, sensor histidine kinase YesM
LALLLLSAAAMVAIVLLFSRGFTRRVFGLIGTMREFESGNRTVRGEPGFDEIGQLIGIFNKMADTIDHLISETLEARLRMQDAELERMRLEGARKETQLQYLQSTINPHYLFNTLESIRMRTLLNGDRVTAKVIRIFAQSFREVITSAEIEVPLRRELDLVNAFITIQKYRFGKRLSFDVQCGPGVEEACVPRFLLQPLVENAIFHGVEKKIGRGSVRIALSEVGSMVVVEVADDGVGMAEARVREIRAAIAAEEPSASCAALRNIYQRLRLLYGDEFSFRLQSTRGEGTLVRVVIPRR